MEECERIYYSNGYCHFHYIRWSIHGDPLPDKPRQIFDPGRGCEIPLCEGDHYALGKCKRHYYMAQRMENVDGEQCTFVLTAPIAAFIEQLTFRYTYDEIAERAGVSVGSLEQWAHVRTPRMRFDLADRIVSAFYGDPNLLEVAS